MNDISMTTEICEKPAIILVEPYLSEAYARAENDRLWGRVWQIACRMEEIPNVGDYVTYDILDESIIVVRSAPDKISAYYNVCLHRGRRLTEGSGHAAQFFCRFHGWRWNLDGENAFVLDGEDWGGCLTPQNLRMKQVSVDTWGGYVFINMDPDCGTLRDYLETVPAMLDPFEIDKMRYRWRQWLYMPCNWKTAIEAFIEGYHATATHPQLVKHATARTWSRADGKHSCFGAAGSKGFGGGTSGAAGAVDMRAALGEHLNRLYEESNASTTETIVKAASRLVDELPPDAPGPQVVAHLMTRARADDAARGVIWPVIDPKHFAEAGLDWHVFPNSIILQGPTFVLGYRARPNGYDPNSCIFEIYVLERFPEGQEPKTELLFKPEQTVENWRVISCQDFSNMSAVQLGMKSRGFPGARPNPVQERPVTNFHRNLSHYMGTGHPQPC